MLYIYITFSLANEFGCICAVSWFNKKKYIIIHAHV